MTHQTRRQLLAALAAGTVGSLAAPLVRTVPAAAQVVASCAPETLDWDDFDVDDVFTSTLVGGTTVSFSTTGFNGVTFRPQNGTVQPEPWGGFNGQYLRLDMVPAQQFDGQQLTFTFSQPVVNLTLPLLDVDNQAGAWGDRVIPSAGFTASIPGTSTIIGAGTLTPFDPFRNTSGTNVASTATTGNFSVTWAGPVTSVDILYFNQQYTGGVNQAIGIGDITFQPCPPAGAGAGFRAGAQAPIDLTRIGSQLVDAAATAPPDPPHLTTGDGGAVVVDD